MDVPLGVRYNVVTQFHTMKKQNRQLFQNPNQNFGTQ
jgi:hypothetical protein